MATQQQLSSQQEMLRQRLPFVILAVLIISMGLLLRVISFQFEQDARVQRVFAANRDANTGRIERFESDRGLIFDRSGNPLAVNTRRYRVSISPNLIAARRSEVAADLAEILDRDPLEMFELLDPSLVNVNLGVVAPEVWQEIRDLDLDFAIVDERIQQRLYPQATRYETAEGIETGTLGAQITGFVAGEGEGARGYLGVEGYYNVRLSGTVRDREVSNIPLGQPQDNLILEAGANLVLTIDRDVQALVEDELRKAVEATGSQSGHIIVMDPRNGDILAMAAYPTFDPNNFADPRYTQADLRNPVISDMYEPGSVFKVVTIASALEMGSIGENWSYNDTGLFEIGGIEVENWDRQPHGNSFVRDVIVDSLNVGTATIAVERLGADDFYQMINQFGIGRQTQVDLEGEAGGILRTPYDVENDWSPSDLATNSFGQGLSVTSLQMLTAVNAIANDGQMMRPRIVYQIVDGDNVVTSRPAAIGNPISAETANLVTNMMVDAVEQGLDEAAQVPGYTIAGKTGTAQIWGVTNYLPNDFMMSVVGFLPADDPQISVLVMLDRPQTGRFASQVVAPIFADLAESLVLLMQIPNDQVRLQLAAEGVSLDGSD